MDPHVYSRSDTVRGDDRERGSRWALATRRGDSDMVTFCIRFDFRSPPEGRTSMAERYAAGLDMMEWADRLGAASIVLSEHHGSDDGYLPSALSMAAAAAARTSGTRIMVAAVVAALHDPVRLAEQATVVDLISKGRLDLVLVNGYMANEFAMVGCSMSERARRTEEAVSVLRQAFTGEPFERQGRRVQVTPQPTRPGGPTLLLGGSTEPAARRAARIADSFLPSTPGIWEFYRDELRSLGKPDPGPYAGGDTSVVHLATDVEDGWRTLAPFALHEVNAYGRSMVEAGITDTGGYEPVADTDALRASGQYRVVTPDQLVTELVDKGPAAFVMLHPMVGGLPPAAAWESLRLFEHEVLPRL
jgi:alkanesulfonate monooxygenase SsuD/methylene tetrahydromethanopterin reductase-like flavin-dependent oxidoreductase (luciferase family)